MLNISHAEDAFLSGEADFQEWRDQFEAQWYAPLGRSLIGGMIQSLPPEVLAQLRQQLPGQMMQLDEMIGRR